MTRYVVRLAALAAVALLVLALAGCGGGDSSKAEPVTVTEQVTVTDATTDAAPTTESEPTTDATTDASSSDTPEMSDAEIDQIAGIYKSFLGLNDDQAKCLVREAQKLSGVNTEDPAALMSSGALEIFSNCGISLEDLAKRMGGR